MREEEKTERVKDRERERKKESERERVRERERERERNEGGSGKRCNMFCCIFLLESDLDWINRTVPTKHLKFLFFGPTKQIDLLFSNLLDRGDGQAS